MSAEPDLAGRARDVRFRPMTIPDVGLVAAVEQASYQFPWSEGVFRDCVRVGYLCRVVEYRGEIGGYGIMSFGAGEAHILNVCVRTDLRGLGVGRRLMDYLLDRARERERSHRMERDRARLHYPRRAGASVRYLTGPGRRA